MAGYRMRNFFGFFFLKFVGLLLNASGLTRDVEIVPQNYLRWNYTHMNQNCSYVGNYVQCEDIRTCCSAVATLAMGGWPTLCGWVGEGVPKVCCGLPLVLGKKLMEKVDEENARKRKCGAREFDLNLSETEAKFLKILARVMPFVVTPDPNMFDPPLSETVYGPRKPDYLVGGVPTRQGFFSWMVSIRKDGKHLCGGTLIDRNHILSAAHCFASDRKAPNPSDYIVHVGNIYVDDGYPFNIRKIVIHSGYNPPYLYHDLVILTLSKEILSPQVAHICLPSPEIATKDFTGEKTTLLGWRHNLLGGNATYRLHIMDNLPVVHFEDCKRAYRTAASGNLAEGLTEDFMCTGLMEGDRKDICQGYAGGPLMYTNDRRVDYSIYADVPWVQVGMVSLGFKCGEPGFPGVYIKVANYLDWITKTMNE